MVLQACLNGDRASGVPRSPEELGAEARACVAAGAGSLHAHPRDPDGHESLGAADIAAAVRELRTAGVEVSLSTGLWITAGDVDARLRAVTDWTECPDLVSLNLSEEGWRELADVLAENGVRYRMLAGLDAADAQPLAEPVPVDEDTTALLQLTSGSTAEPKAVRISHANLYANAQAMVSAAELRPERDVVVSWLPLFHDMGMVGCLTVPMMAGIEAIGFELFAARPAEGLTAVKIPADLDGSAFLKKLESRYGVKVAGGQAHLKGKIFRVAHMGIVDELDILATLSAIEMVLDELGRPVQFGAGVAAASQVLSEARAVPAGA